MDFGIILAFRNPLQWQRPIEQIMARERGGGCESREAR